VLATTSVPSLCDSYHVTDPNGNVPATRNTLISRHESGQAEETSQPAETCDLRSVL